MSTSTLDLELNTKIGLPFTLALSNTITTGVVSNTTPGDQGRVQGAGGPGGGGAHPDQHHGQGGQGKAEGGSLTYIYSVFHDNGHQE